MTESLDKLTPFDPPIQTENIAFDAGEMIACGGCGRMNPPNRLKCIYCSNALEIKPENAATIKPVLRKLEVWERGFSVIVRERSDVDADAAARFLSAERDDLASIIETDVPLPIARVESEPEASVLITGLAKCGLTCSLISDDDLAADKPHVRLSKIDIIETGFVFKDFNTGKETEVKFSDLALIVPGLITASRLDSLEQKGRKGKTKLVDETATASDETILDIYSRHDRTGFRIHLTGFDFSCLGYAKGMVAAENMRRLIAFLTDMAPNAKLISDYNALRYALGLVWEVESRKDSLGLRRSGFGRVEFGSVASTINLNQFTKFSRLQWHLI